MRIAVLLAAAAVTVAGSGVSASGQTSETGLQGKVLRGPITPVCRVDRPCYAPYRGTIVFTRLVGAAASEPPIRTLSEPDGDYRIALAPARYRVSTGKPSRFGGLVRPSIVTVPATGVRRVNLLVDTGIR